jgi:hypothetical protein
MAILANVNIRGLQVNNAYIKILNIGGSKVYDWAVIYGIYQSKQHSSDPANCLQTIVLKFDYNNGKAIYKEAYDVLKLSDFMSHIRSVANVNAIENYDILQSIQYTGDA